MGLMAAMFAGAQEKPTGILTSISPPTILLPKSRYWGDVEYGQSKTAAPYSAGPRYRAFVFTGYGGDQVEITVKRSEDSDRAR